MKKDQLTVVGGRLKKSKLKSPKEEYDLYTSPMTNFLKSAIFNLLIGQIDNKTTVLDLYAGSGQLGIEAISRGAKRAVFVELSNSGVKTLKDNIYKLDIREESEIIQDTVENYLNDDIVRSDDIKDQEKFNIIFASPPFKDTVEEQFYDVIHLAKFFLKPGGIIVMHHPTSIELGNRERDIVLADQREYGNNAVSFYVLPYVKSM